MYIWLYGIHTVSLIKSFIIFSNLILAHARSGKFKRVWDLETISFHSLFIGQRNKQKITGPKSEFS